MKLNKSLGLHSLILEFYKTFLLTLKILLVKVLNMGPGENFDRTINEQVSYLYYLKRMIFYLQT